MSITSVKLLSKEGNVTAAAREYTVIYQVLTDSSADGPWSIYSAGMPQIGTAYALGSESDPLAFCRSVVPKRTDTLSGGGARWEVTCRYSTSASDPQKLPNPMARPPLRSWGGQLRETFPFYDLNKKAFVNSALCRFDPPIPVVVPYGVLTITRNEPAFYGQSALYYQGSVNASPFYGFAKGYALMQRIEAQEDLHENGFVYAKVTYEIAFRRPDDDPWQPVKVIDHGPYWVKVEDDKRIREHRLPDDKINSTASIMLDGGGSYLPYQRLVKGDVQYLAFDCYRERGWGSLGLEW